MAKKLTPQKAREILHDKSVHGQPLTDKQRKFFGAVASGAPVKKETGGWLDNYQEGGSVESRQGGYTNIPFRYNSAWGGQFAMGGSIPGTLGFTYARTNSPAPSEGPYAKKTMPSAQDGKDIYPIDLRLPKYEKPKPFFTGYGFSQNPVPNVNIHGVGVYGTGNLNDRLNLSSSINSASVFYPGGEKMFMKPNVNVGLKYKFDNGGSMSFYQHGLDWTPRNISKNGSLIPIAQTGDFVPPKYTMPRVSSESTAIIRQTPKGQISTSTTGATKQQMKETSDVMMRQTKKEEQEKQARIAERKSAVAAKDKGQAFTLPSGEIKKYEDMDAREKMYVSGKALEQRGRINENEESFFDEWINPLNWIGGAASSLGTAPLEAKQSNSNLPYVSAIANPLIMGAMGFDPLGSALKVPGKVAQSMESGLLSNTWKLNPWAFKPQEGMMYRGLGKEGFEDAMQSGVFRPKQYGYSETRSLAEKVTTPKQFGSTFYAPSNKFGVVESYGPSYVAEVPFEGNQFARRYGRKDWSWSTPKEIPINEGRLLQKDWLRGYKPIETPSVVNPTSVYEDYFKNIQTNNNRLQNLLSSKKITYDDYLKQQDLYEQELQKGLGLGERLGSGTYGTVFKLTSDPSKVVKLGNPYGNKWTPELIENLKSVNQNANIAIPEKVEYFKIPSEWKGYEPTTKEVMTMPNLNEIAAENLNLSKRDRYAYFLKQARQLRDRGIKLDVENPENFKFNQSKNVFDIYDVNPGNINNPAAYMRYIKEKTQRHLLDNMMYKKGGIIKDDRGQWAHPGEITEIGSNRITMQGVPYPVLGISDQGDTQMMFPGEEYKFKGKKVTEIPMAQNGVIKVSDPNDPRLKSYSDSLYNYNIGQRMAAVLDKDKNLVKVKPGSPYDKHLQKGLSKTKNNLTDNTAKSTGYKNYDIIGNIMKEYQAKGNKGILPIRYQGYFPNPDNTAIDLVTLRGIWDALGVTDPRPPASANIPQWKKPVEEVVYDPSIKKDSPKPKQLPPIYTSDPNDPRLRAYNDSLSLYKGYRNYDLDKTKPIEVYDKNDMATLRAMYPNTKLIERKAQPLNSYDQWVLTQRGRKTNFKVGKTYSNKELALEQNKAEQYENTHGNRFTKNKGNLILDRDNRAIRSSTIAPIGMGYGDMKDTDNWNAGLVTIYKKPVQPVIYQEEPTLNKKVSNAEPIRTSPNYNPQIIPLQGSDVQLPPIQQGNYMVGYIDENNQGVDRGFVTPEQRAEFVKELEQRNMSSVQPYRGNITEYDRRATQTKKVNKKQNGGWLDGYK